MSTRKYKAFTETVDRTALLNINEKTVVTNGLNERPSCNAWVKSSLEATSIANKIYSVFKTYVLT